MQWDSILYASIISPLLTLSSMLVKSSQSLLISEVLDAFHQLRCPSLYSFYGLKFMNHIGMAQLPGVATVALVWKLVWDRSVWQLCYH